MERWSDGAMERWGDGTMERWSDGAMDAGVLPQLNDWTTVNLEIRPATELDAPAMAAIFFHTIRQVNMVDYAPMQIDAWAGPAPDPDRWKARLAGRHTFVVCHAQDVVGFAELEPDGHVDAVYVHHEYQKCGVGSMLLSRIEEEAVHLNLGRLFTEASITALPFFRRRGFEVVQQQEVAYRGSMFTNYRMEYTMPHVPIRS